MLTVSPSIPATAPRAAFPAACCVAAARSAGDLLNRAVRRDRICLEAHRFGFAGEILQPCFFLQRLDAQHRTAWTPLTGDFFENQRSHNVLFFGRRLRQRGHCLP